MSAEHKYFKCPQVISYQQSCITTNPSPLHQLSANDITMENVNVFSYKTAVDLDDNSSSSSTTTSSSSSEGRYNDTDKLDKNLRHSKNKH